MSPGQIDGSMLKPLTRRRSAPNLRITSAARSHFKFMPRLAQVRPEKRGQFEPVHLMLGDLDEGFVGLPLWQRPGINAVGFEKLYRR